MIIIVGTPGAGKTTQTKMLAEYLHCPWFSMGQLIRDNARGQARTDMLAGKIIDDKTTLYILSEALKNIDTYNNELVVEGNPRSVVQAKWWLEQIGAKKIKLTAIIHLVVSERQARDRLDKRGRIDDNNGDVVKERFTQYKSSIVPTLKYLESKGLKVQKIDASASIDEIQQAIRRVVATANAT